MGRPRKNSLSAGAIAATLSKKISILPEFFDINTGIDGYWEALLKRFSKISRIYGFSRAEAPLLEDIKLYQKFYGTANPDFLVKFEQGHLLAALRPSQLPGILRYFIQQKLNDPPGIYKWHYSGFTTKVAASGELNSDYEFGCEILGGFSHLSEAQSIVAAWEFLTSLELEELTLEINNLGSQECQQSYGRALVDALLPKKYELCDNCNEDLSFRPLYVFRCPNLDCQAVFPENVPTILDFLDQDSHKDFTHVLEALDEMHIAYQLNPFYAGNNLSEKTNFAVKCKLGEKTLSLAEGGHHGSLAKAAFGKDFGAFGFFGSFKTLKQVLEANSEPPVFGPSLSEVCLVPLGELAAKRSLRLFRDLTAQKIMVYDHFGLSGVKNQLKVAQDQKVPIALIMGQKEAMDEMVILRDVKSGMQEIISYDKIVEEVKKRLGK